MQQLAMARPAAHFSLKHLALPVLRRTRSQHSPPIEQGILPEETELLEHHEVIAGVILPASNVKSGAGTVAVARGSNSEASVVNKADSGKAVQPPEKRPQKANDREESAVA